MLVLAACVSREPDDAGPPPPGVEASAGEARLLPDNLVPDLAPGAGGPADRSDLDRLCEAGRAIARDTDETCGDVRHGS